jgi:alkanesulfonate monooxygenase SsuD/methylene tetrahydromethanopterin reductase-like flavin-dependent oxidoreductase (luciferase family)
VIRTWAFSLFQCNDAFAPGFDEQDPVAKGQAYRETYARYLDLFAKCEEWGFEGVFLAEHHFDAAMLSPSPHIFMAALAARTRTLRVGCLGDVLPLHDPRRFLEECGMLNNLSDGRLEIGIAPGLHGEAEKAGIPEAELRPRFYSSAEMLAKALAGPRITHQDEYFNFKDLQIVPPINGADAPDVWVSVMSPGSAQWCAERRWKMCTAYVPTDVAVALADAYRATADDAGWEAGPEMLGLRRRVFVAPTDAEADEIVERSVDTQLVLADRVAFEPADPKIAAMLSNPDDIIAGSPTTVTERLIDQCRAGGFGQMLTFTDYRLFDHDDLVRSHKLIGTEVVPVLREATLDRSSSAST